MKKLRLLISVALVLGFMILPAYSYAAGNPGSGMSSSSSANSNNIQITTSRTYGGSSSFSSFGGASAYPQQSVQQGKSNKIPVPMSPPTLDPQEIASVSSTRLIIDPAIHISNMFYINNYPLTVSSCGFSKEVPTILDIRNSGHLYGYEWYPDGELHTQDMGYVASGTKKESFYGDSPGLHILQYYCKGWSNYIYIYVT